MTPDEEGEYNYQSIQSEIEFLKEFTSPFIVSYRDGYFFGKDLWVSCDVFVSAYEIRLSSSIAREVQLLIFVTC